MQKKIFSVIFICLFIFVACSQDEPAIKVDLDKKEQVSLKEEADVITYACLPQYSHRVSYQRHYKKLTKFHCCDCITHRVSYQRHHPLVEFLRKETGFNIKQIFPDTFNQHMTMVGQGKIDISYSNPFIYIKIAHRYGAGAFARIAEIYNQENFRGQIICQADNRLIKTVGDCRGKSWLSVDSTSGGSYLFPLGHFIDHGIQKTDFSEIAFAPGPGGKQEKVVLAVYAGKYDVGTIRKGTLNVVADKIDINEIRVIANTRWYPGWIYAARAGLEPKVVEKIGKALLKLDFNQKEHQHILEAADFIGVIPSDDQDFNPVRELAARVSISLEK